MKLSDLLNYLDAMYPSSNLMDWNRFKSKEHKVIGRLMGASLSVPES